MLLPVLTSPQHLEQRAALRVGHHLKTNGLHVRSIVQVTTMQTNLAVLSSPSVVLCQSQTNAVPSGPKAAVWH